MKQLKRFTNEDIRKFGPCYDPNEYCKDSESYTALDIIDHEYLNFRDKLWVLLRTDFISERTMRLFRAQTYRKTLEFIKDPDAKSVNVLNVAAEAYANGQASKEQLATAWSAYCTAVASAWSNALSVTQSAQQQKLKQMILDGIETGDSVCE